MNTDKWQQTKGHIQDTFANVDISEQVLPEPEVGTKEVVLFDGPMGRMKLEYYTKPVVLDRQTHGSRRIGSHTAVEYVYSKDEVTNFLKVFKWDDDQDEWQEMAMAKESFIL